ncbi:MAG: PKD domain-containing protein [Bacteroidota bacterium]|nr:PKD domain-containing protein [Bacteroidota bacterium]
MKKLFSTNILLLGIYTFLNAQTFTNRPAEKIIQEAHKVILNSKTNNISFFELKNNISVPVKNLSSWLPKSLRLSDNYNFKEFKVEKDKLGYTHCRQQLCYQNIPVEGSVFYIHSKDGNIKSGNGNILTDNKPNSTKPQITENDALEKAKEIIGASSYKWENSLKYKTPVGEIVFVPKGDKLVLSYKFDIFSTKPFGRYFVYINANDGSLVSKVNRILTSDTKGTAVTRYSGTQTIMTSWDSNNQYYVLEETGRGGGIITADLNNSTDYSNAVDFTDTDNYWNSTTNQDNVALDAHFNAEKYYDLLHNVFGRNSLDNNGKALVCIVHFDNKFSNAFWDGEYTAYGDGDDTKYTPFTATDVVGHEFTHGLVQNTANLAYSGEPLTLNEALADIFGTILEFYVSPSTANWTIAEKITTDKKGIRSMSDPKSFQCPDTYKGLYWGYTDSTYHENAGVAEYWFYLLSQGGNGKNDNGVNYSINGIGLDKAAQIIYRTLTVYLSMYSDYNDLRTHSIQAAIDLYGECSEEVFETTNAWNAVGVGNSYSSNKSIVAEFTPSQTSTCIVPSTINFTDSSKNATSYYWNFGDGTTDNAINPSHTFTSAGKYNVTLIAKGSTYCGTSDTTTNIITITDGKGPIAADCTPKTQYPGQDYGILNVSFNNINNSSGLSNEGNIDYSCDQSTTVTEGLQYPLTVLTNNYYNENVKVWIDLNNNGKFDSLDLVFNSSNKLHNHTTNLLIPGGAVPDKSLRMRVGSDAYSYPLNSSCQSRYGQFEDYSVIIKKNDAAPKADFIADDTTIYAGNTVKFSDQSLNVPKSWKWIFPGGNPATSDLQNPTVTYNTKGKYNVTLIVTNTNGSDTLVKTSYINVTSDFNMCSATSTNAISGTLYDSGGQNNNYSNYETCYFLIKIPCAKSITLSFNSFNTESNYDYLTVYDGSSTSGKQLLNASGTTIPSAVTATSGSMYIVFHSNGSTTNTGFKADWSSIVSPNIPPVAAFAISDTNAPLNTNINFTDSTSNIPLSWKWSFGDGYSSSNQNPIHKYSTSGTYNVKLITKNCSYYDTIEKTIYIQKVPQLSYRPSSVKTTISNCGDSVQIPITIYNNGVGDLKIEPINNSQPEILAYTNGADMSGEYANTIKAINSYFTDYNLTETNTSSPDELKEKLKYKQILLIPKLTNCNYSTFTSMSTVIQNFVNEGGTVIICSGLINYNNSLMDIGLFSGSFYTYTSSSTLTVQNTNNPITYKFPATITAQPYTYIYSFTNPDYVSLIKYNSSADAVGYRPIGKGKAIFIGFNYYSNDNYSSQIIANAVKWSINQALGKCLHVNFPGKKVSYGDSTTINFTLSSNGLNSGTYNKGIIINTNDSANSTIIIPCNFTVAGNPSINIVQNNINFGTILKDSTITDTIKIINTGCKALTITNMIPSVPEFNVNNTKLTIQPFDSSNVVISFTPDAYKSFSGKIKIYNNDKDTNICVTGTGIGYPESSFSSTAINSNINNCNSVDSIPLTIYNKGRGDLIYKISNSGIDKVKILSYTYGANLNGEYANTIKALNNYYTNYDLYETNTTNPNVLQKLFNDKKILLIPKLNNASSSTILSMNSVIQNFINNGGSVIFCSGYCNNGSFLTNTGLFSGSFYNYSYSNYSLNIQNSNDSITYKFPNTITSNNLYIYTYALTNPDLIRLVKYNNYDVVSYRKIGKGRAIFIGDDFYYNNDYFSRMLANTVRWAGTDGNFPDWLKTNKITDTISKGDSALLNIKILSDNLISGTYSANIIINSNDSLNSYDTISVKLNLSGKPEIYFNKSAINFGNILIGKTKTDTLFIINKGCKTLNITNIIPSIPEFSTNPTKLTVQPFDKGYIKVSFSPEQIKSYSGNIKIYNNDTDTTIYLRGNGDGLPTISFNSDSVVAKINSCNDSTTIPLKIYNKGNGILNYNISYKSGKLQILTYTYGVNTTNYNNIKNDIITSGIDYTLTETNTSVASDFQKQLSDKDLLIIPYINYNVNTITGYTSIIQDFIKKGGNIIIFDGYQYLTNLGLFTGSYYDEIYTGNYLTVNDTSNPITFNFPKKITFKNYAYLFSLKDSNITSLIKYNNYSIVGFKKFGLGKAYFINSDYQNADNYISKIHTNTLKFCTKEILANWLIINNKSGNINKQDSAILDLKFKSSGLISSKYSYKIAINSNDTLNPNDSIPIKLIVNGKPEINFAKSNISFGNLMDGHSTNDSLLIYNKGCAPLIISNISVSNSDFKANLTKLTIQAGDSGKVKITFSPNSIKTYNDKLFFKNNDKDTSICLNGKGYGAPKFSEYPSVVNSIINSCNGTCSASITIYNKGQNTLKYYINNPPAQSKVEILAFTNGINTDEYANTINSIKKYYTNFNITETNTSSSTSLKSQLKDKNILLIPRLRNASSSTIISMSQVIQDFVKNGGNVIICSGYSSSDSYLMNLGLFNGTFQYYSSGYYLYIQDKNHPITYQFPSSFYCNSNIYCYNFKDPDIIRLVKYSQNYDAVAYRQIGKGKAIYLGFDYYYNNDYTSKIISNSVKWVATGDLPDWIKISQAKDSVNIGDSVKINFNFNSTNLNSGKYSTSIVFKSNDPYSSSDTIPVILTVKGKPSISASLNSINYDSIMQYTSDSSKKIDIYNKGCDTLKISNITTNHSGYSISPDKFYILPGDTETISIKYLPANAGIINDTLFILNNDKTKKINISAYVYKPPVISVSPASFNVSLNSCGDSTVKTINITNNGSSTLTYNTGICANSKLNILALKNGADLNYYSNTIKAINQYFTDYTLTEANLTTPSGLKDSLRGIDILLIPPLTSAPSEIAKYSDVLQEYTKNGGTIIICAGYNYNYGGYLFNTGLFSGSTYGSIYNNLTVNNPNHPITYMFPSTINYQNSTYSVIFSNKDIVRLITSNGYDIVSYRPIGLGKAIFIGFNYYNSDKYSMQIISNSVKWIRDNAFNRGVLANKYSGSVANNGNSNISLNFNSKNLNGGTYKTLIKFYTNDPKNPVIQIPCTLNVSNNPCADFDYLQPECGGNITFTDHSKNVPTSYKWDFGDGQTSTLKSTTHIYKSTGIFNAKLIACNSNGCDTIIKPISLTNINSPVQSSCTPIISSINSSYGISKVTFNTISNTSSLGQGYMNFTCSQSTMIKAGNNYTLSVITGNGYYHNVRAWIDYNNDGTFSSNELVLSSNSATSHSTNILIPDSALTDIPLRLRVAGNYYNYSYPTSCSESGGDIEDYTVIIQSNISLPVALFDFDLTDNCQGNVQFTDKSENKPISWLWDFGDGNTSSAQNPYHTYTSGGSYRVMLKITNKYGKSSVESTVNINMLNPKIITNGPLYVNQTITFSCDIKNATKWDWNFGDSKTSSLASPTHVYTTDANFMATLQVSNAICSASTEKWINIEIGNFVKNITNNNVNFMIYPNPTTGKIYFKTNNSNVLKDIEILDMLGRKVYSSEQLSADSFIDVSNFAPGIYYLKTIVNDKLVNAKFNYIKYN